MIKTEVNEMTKEEQATNLIDKYTDLQRIKAAADRDKELEFQLRVTKGKLEELGVVTESFNL